MLGREDISEWAERPTGRERSAEPLSDLPNESPALLKYTFMTESAKGTAAIVLVSSDSASAQASQASLPVRPEALVAAAS